LFVTFGDIIDGLFFNYTWNISLDDIFINFFSLFGI
jgi:hypothetical protein